LDFLGRGGVTPPLRKINIRRTEMKTFEFVAFNSSGKKRAGTVRARGLAEAKRKVQQKGFYLASIEVQDGQNPLSFFREIKELFFSKEKISV